jgi:hypothetical protein
MNIDRDTRPTYSALLLLEDGLKPGSILHMRALTPARRTGDRLS